MSFHKTDRLVTRQSSLPLTSKMPLACPITTWHFTSDTRHVAAVRDPGITPPTSDTDTWHVSLTFDRKCHRAVNLSDIHQRTRRRPSNYEYGLSAMNILSPLLAASVRPSVRPSVEVCQCRCVRPSVCRPATSKHVLTCQARKALSTNKCCCPKYDMICTQTKQKSHEQPKCSTQQYTDEYRQRVHRTHIRTRIYAHSRIYLREICVKFNYTQRDSHVLLA